MKAKRSAIPDRRITYWDLFGWEVVDDQYQREKMFAENVRRLHASIYLTRSRNSIGGVAEQAHQAGVGGALREKREVIS